MQIVRIELLSDWKWKSLTGIVGYTGQERLRELQDNINNKEDSLLFVLLIRGSVFENILVKIQWT